MITSKISKNILWIVLCSCLVITASGPLGTGVTFTNPQPTTAVPLLLVKTNSAVTPVSLWQKMSDEFRFDTTDHHHRVEKQIDILLADKKDFVRSLATEAPYIAYAFQQTQKRGLPAELALLPVIESDCNPHARSPVGAVGLWQLMPETAADLGLNCDYDNDERKNIAASTKAALRFLIDLHNTFRKDWMLTLAAYNDGPANISKALQRQKHSFQRGGYWDLHLPKETEDYVPKLLALAAIVRDPAHYGLKLPSTTNMAELSVKELQDLPSRHSHLMASSSSSRMSNHKVFHTFSRSGINTALAQQLIFSGADL